jgi:hypothetical protein
MPVLISAHAARPIDARILNAVRPRTLPLRYLLIPVFAFVYLYLALQNGGPIVFQLNRGAHLAHLYDEGIPVTGAVRILNGGVMYRDWEAHYAPGQWYMLAGLFKLFGTSLAVERLWDFFARALVATAVYVFASKLTSLRVGFLPFVVVVIWLASCGFYGYPMFPALAFTMISMTCLLAFIRVNRSVWLVASGATLGVATFFRHDVGGYAAFTQVLTLTIFLLLNAKQFSRGYANKLVQLGRVFAPYAAGFASPLIPVIIYFLCVVSFDELFSSLVLFPLNFMSGSWSLPQPPLMPRLTTVFDGDVTMIELLAFVTFGWIPFYVPLLLYSVGLLTVSMLILRPHLARKTGLDPWGLLLLTLFGMTLFNQAVNRNDHIHLLPTLIMSAILLATLYYHAGKLHWERFLAWMTPLLVLVVLSWSAHSLFFFKRLAATASSAAQTSISPEINLHPVLRDQAEAIEFIQRRTAASETIFVGNARHDISSVNDAMFYFLSGRLNATRYDELLANRVSRLDVQEEIIRDLQAKNVRHVILFSGLIHYSELNQSSVSSGVTVLDDFIRDSYEIEANLGHYSVLAKR